MDKENKFDIKIYESSKLPTDIGAGILFSPRAIQILKAIGLGDQIVTILPDGCKGWFDFCPLLIFLLKKTMSDSHLVVRKGDQPEGFHVHKVKGMHNQSD